MNYCKKTILNTIKLQVEGYFLLMKSRDLLILGRVLDSEEDSDMDDFIDDGDEDLDYSKHIKEIFGYDKARSVVAIIYPLMKIIHWQLSIRILLL